MLRNAINKIMKSIFQQHPFIKQTLITNNLTCHYADVGDPPQVFRSHLFDAQIEMFLLARFIKHYELNFGHKFF